MRLLSRPTWQNSCFVQPVSRAPFMGCLLKDCLAFENPNLQDPNRCQWMVLVKHSYTLIHSEQCLRQKRTSGHVCPAELETKCAKTTVTAQSYSLAGKRVDLPGKGVAAVPSFWALNPLFPGLICLHKSTQTWTSKKLHRYELTPASAYPGARAQRFL